MSEADTWQMTLYHGVTVIGNLLSHIPTSGAESEVGHPLGRQGCVPRKGSFSGRPPKLGSIISGSGQTTGYLCLYKNRFLTKSINHESAIQGGS